MPADQDIEELENYWLKVSGNPKRLFYKASIDLEIIEKFTKRKNHKRVFGVDYFDSKGGVQHDLESLSDLVYNFVLKELTLKISIFLRENSLKRACGAMASASQWH